MFLRLTSLCSILLLLLSPLRLHPGPGGGLLTVQAGKDDDFSEFEEDDDSEEFDFEVSEEEEDEDCEGLGLWCSFCTAVLFAVAAMDAVEEEFQDQGGDFDEDEPLVRNQRMCEANMHHVSVTCIT